MLIFSSREFEGRAAMSVTDQQFTAHAARRAQTVRKHLPQTPQASWKMVQMDCDVDDNESINKLLPLFQEARPLLLYLHGYHSTSAVFFERCDRLQSLYGLEMVRFSWSSKKHLRDDGFSSAVDAGMDDGLQQQLARLFGSQASLPSIKCPAPIYSVAGDLDNLTCSWWLLMALAGVRH